MELVWEGLYLRRKEILSCFINILSKFMFNNHYRFYKNCFVKFQDDMFNRVNMDTIMIQHILSTYGLVVLLYTTIKVDEYI